MGVIEEKELYRDAQKGCWVTAKWHKFVNRFRKQHWQRVNLGRSDLFDTLLLGTKLYAAHHQTGMTKREHPVKFHVRPSKGARETFYFEVHPVPNASSPPQDIIKREEPRGTAHFFDDMEDPEGVNFLTPYEADIYTSQIDFESLPKLTMYGSDGRPLPTRGGGWACTCWLRENRQKKCTGIQFTFRGEEPMMNSDYGICYF
ncbi:hypothetical protein AJ79_04136 [Helicocarpus griseus UAMH5409]|uniref:Uncharacterized protein n=1 Tax=Helicocarpus griseus UAMH5409 TaxID=1447875 RepID=A0A2B7XVQ3_9EURO|nr:hypothetical protein AJ79_04136 [Helicocarpus griseus UAMH5409]